MDKDLNIKFYDELSEDYHLIFDSWEDAMKRQALILQNIISKHAKPKAQTVLDCACGIGTQALGLASLGYKVSGSDLSPKSIERAKAESQKRGLSISFTTADFRTLDKDIPGTFDVVIACDNSLPHLLDDSDVLLTAKNILTKMEYGGIFIASIRDYDKILIEKPQSTQPIVKNSGGQRTVSFQVWDWLKDDIYRVNHFTLKGKEESYTTHLRKTMYRAYRRHNLTTLFEMAGFTEISWLMPEQSGYYQPILLCKKC